MPWHDADLIALPKAFRAMVAGYVEYGREPPSVWLTAVLCNDLIGFLESHSGTRDHIADAAAVLRVLESAPIECWGTREKVSRWMRGGGLRGQVRADGRIQ